MGKLAKRRRSRGSLSKVVIPSTVEKAPENETNAHNMLSFFGSKLARPALVGNPDQSVQKFLKNKTTRMHFVSSVQPLMEWAAGAPLKHGGVAPQWVGKAPHKPMTSARAYQEDLRENLLNQDPSLRLLTDREQLKVGVEKATASGEPASFSDLSEDRQSEYAALAAVDQKRYTAEVVEYEKVNPGWQAFEARSRKGGLKQRPRKRPQAPPDAQHVFLNRWLQTKGAIAPDSEKLKEAAHTEWASMKAAQQQLFETVAAEARQQYEAALAEWTKQCDERRAKRRALQPKAVTKAEQAESDSQSVSDSESGDEVAAARWGLEHCETRLPLTEVKEVLSPAGRCTRASRTAAAQGAEEVAEGSARQEDTKRNSPGSDSKAAKAPTGGRGPSGRAAAARKPAVKRSNTDAEENDENDRKRAKAAAAVSVPLSPLPKAGTKQEAMQNALKRTERLMQVHKSDRPPAFPTDPAELVGESISDTFLNENNKRQVFSGKITKFEFARITDQGLTPLWEVTFEDGDCGEKEWHELKDTLCTWPPPGLY